ncbi:hypothetical protein [Acetobacter sp.]|uniref:hypothetical protein n=1 Tax=Acetobacter sp. TaxID=440 RepID=UPI0039E87683
MVSLCPLGGISSSGTTHLPSYYAVPLATCAATKTPLCQSMQDAKGFDPHARISMTCRATGHSDPQRWC